MYISSKEVTLPIVGTKTVSAYWGNPWEQKGAWIRLGDSIRDDSNDEWIPVDCHNGVLVFMDGAYGLSEEIDSVSTEEDYWELYGKAESTICNAHQESFKL